MAFARGGVIMANFNNHSVNYSLNNIVMKTKHLPKACKAFFAVIAVMLFCMTWSEAKAQTVVVLNVPDPCAQNGIEEPVQTTFGFNVYPNPADKAVTLSFSDMNPIGRVEVVVTDMRGVAVMRSQYHSNFNELRTEMSLGKLAPGVYTISVRGKGTYSVKKLIIK